MGEKQKMKEIIVKLIEFDDEIGTLNRNKKDESDNVKKKEIDNKIKEKKKQLNKYKKENWPTFIKKVPELIKEDPNCDFIEISDLLGKRFQNNDLTTSQIRNVFGEVKKIEMKAKNGLDIGALAMLKPKLAYAAARANKVGTDELRDVLVEAIDTILKEAEEDKRMNYFKNFVNFFEAILAYHKSHGGK